jgi:hypothetical protein
MRSEIDLLAMGDECGVWVSCGVKLASVVRAARVNMI